MLALHGRLHAAGASFRDEYSGEVLGSPPETTEMESDQSKYTESPVVDVLAQAARGEMTAGDVCNIQDISEPTSTAGSASTAT
jgi:fructose 1,6-bisphosphatase